MKHKAILRTASIDPGSIAGSLDVDNVEMEDLSIESACREGRIITKVDSNNIKTLVNTLDDIICCQMVAEGLLTNKQKT